jgi:CHAT domain-containing protein
MQVAGFEQVIAAQWDISDPFSFHVARSVYRVLHDLDQSKSRSAAYALSSAVREVRLYYPDRPVLWAPYVHLGV